MNLVSNFGDVVVLLPASFGLIAFLMTSGSWRDAAAYAMAAAASLTAALFAKLALAACGETYSLFGVASPSGHAAFAATFYGCLAVLFATGRATGWRLTAYGGAAALILLIAASRVALEVHTAPEVAVGLLIGVVTIALFSGLRIKPERLELTSRTMVRASPFALLFALCSLLLGDHWSAERFIDAIAAQLGADLHLCR